MTTPLNQVDYLPEENLKDLARQIEALADWARHTKSVPAFVRAQLTDMRQTVAAVQRGWPDHRPLG